MIGKSYSKWIQGAIVLLITGISQTNSLALTAGHQNGIGAVHSEQVSKNLGKLQFRNNPVAKKNGSGFESKIAHRIQTRLRKLQYVQPDHFINWKSGTFAGVAALFLLSPIQGLHADFAKGTFEFDRGSALADERFVYDPAAKIISDDLTFNTGLQNDFIELMNYYFEVSRFNDRDYPELGLSQQEYEQWKSIGISKNSMLQSINDMVTVQKRFDQNPSALRLIQYMDTNGNVLSTETALSLVRKIAEDNAIERTNPILLLGSNIEKTNTYLGAYLSPADKLNLGIQVSK